MGWFNKKQQTSKKIIPQISQKPKKGKCKIKFKRKDNVEDIEFSPECTSAQIEMAKKMREERNDRE